MNKSISQLSAIMALALVLVFSVVGLSEARGYGMHHLGSGVNLSPENQVKYDAIVKEFYDRMTPIGEKMMAKRTELNALQGNTNADPKRITQLSEEIAALHTQMVKERNALDEKLSKDLGIEMPARGMGRGGNGGWGHGGRGNGPAGGCGSANVGNCGNQGGGNSPCPRN